jgi:hypothetical protein
MKTVTIFSPAYKEEEVLPTFLETVLPRLEEGGPPVVDDGSSNGTAGILVGRPRQSSEIDTPPPTLGS